MKTVITLVSTTTSVLAAEVASVVVEAELVMLGAGLVVERDDRAMALLVNSEVEPVVLVVVGRPSAPLADTELVLSAGWVDETELDAGCPPAAAWYTTMLLTAKYASYRRAKHSSV